MFDFTIFSARDYRYAEKTTWTNPLPTVSLHVSGLVYRKTKYKELQGDPGPSMSFYGPGKTSTYEYGLDRENWVILLNTSDIRTADDGQHCEFLSNDQWVSIPCYIPLSQSEVSFWREEFRAVSLAAKDPSPVGNLRSRVGVAKIISGAIDKVQQLKGETPVERFKLLLDDQDNLNRNISELSHECGYTADHMRIMFSKTYGLSPLNYRNKRRLQLAAELIATGRLSLAEIADQMGFKHVSHFCTAYKKAFGSSPGEDIKRLRSG